MVELTFSFALLQDMLKESGFRLPHKLSLGMFEVPLAACMGAGAAIAAHLHGNMGGWLWVSDLGAADTTLLSPTLFFALYVMRIWVSDGLGIQSCMATRSHNNTTPAWDMNHNNHCDSEMCERGRACVPGDCVIVYVTMDDVVLYMYLYFS